MLSWALRNMEIEVTTFDNLSELNPDIHGDVRQLDRYVSTNEFDLVCAFQVLEHLPFEDADSVISQIAAVTSDKALVSVPYVGWTLGASIWLARRGHRQLHLGYRIPMFWKKHEFDGEHYWELGKRGYSLSRMSSKLKKSFDIVRRVLLSPDRSQVLFVLKKKRLGLSPE